jgi:hypothetical protein
LFVARLRHRSSFDVLRERLDVVARFYAPLGATRTTLTEYDRLGIAIGWLPFEDGPEDQRVWGEPLPEPLRDPAALIAASDSELRAIEGMTLAVAAEDGAARLVTSSSGPRVLHRASGEAITCWSSHAAAAGLIAHGRASVDLDALPELLAFDFVGGERTLLSGVTCEPHATVVDFGADDARERSYWPATERWEALPEADAHVTAEDELRAGLTRRLDPLAPAWLGLTAGLDSRVLAVTAEHAGAFTWGDPGWPDARGAARAAAAAGLAHECLGLNLLDSHEAITEHDREARFTDGLAALAVAARRWPAGARAVVLGMGGEVGRAFYYDDYLAAIDPSPRRMRLAEQLSPGRRLPHASAEAVDMARASVSAWIDDALASGRSGWQALDVVYAEQRVGRWGRGQIPCLRAAFVPGFTPTRVARALMSLPLRERVTSGFHHRLLGETPPRARRVAAPLRSLRRLRLRPRPASDPVDPFLASVWGDRPEARDWVIESVLRDPDVTDRMGTAWSDAVAAGFVAGQRRHAEQALLAAGPIRLAESLRQAVSA